MKQRLAAILVADVSGYSRLMAADERATVDALDSARAVFRVRIEANQGRVIDMAGDSVLAVFETATGAVSAALAVQKDLNTSTSALPEDRRMRFRIGVHLGDVIEKGDGTIYGDGVNIAARLEGLADPGGITVSDSIRNAVKGKVGASFEDQGEQKVKNIADPVRAYRVGPEGDAAPKLKSAIAGIDLSLPDKPSIAVLPFANMSGDPEQEFFIDGITEDIITELSRFHSLFVIARNSSFTYKGKAVDVRTVSKELGVRYVLEGGIRRAANRIRVTAQLIDAQSGNHIWAEKYDRVLEDIFALQEELTRSIVAAIAPQIEEAESATAMRKRPENLSAYEIVVRARVKLLRAYYKQDSALRVQAIAETREALRLDPSSVLALSQLAFGLWQHIFYRTSANIEDAWNEGMEAASRGIEIDRADDSAYRQRGILSALASTRDRWEEALADCRRALELNPNDAVNLQALGWVEVAYGNAKEGIEHLLLAVRVNPRDPWAYSAYVQLALAHFLVRSYAEGLDWGLGALRVEPNLPAAHLMSAICQVGLRQIENAKVELEKARRLAPEYVEARLRGVSVFRRDEDRRRQTLFARIAAGLEDPSAAEALR
jgi:adenylate cyclase